MKKLFKVELSIITDEYRDELAGVDLVMMVDVKRAIQDKVDSIEFVRLVDKIYVEDLGVSFET